ncbi:hypothetical protein C7M84_010523 [Penaeus vannamei]|uniref:Ionotropic glutamate receptor C-terminal domain-containing protein n=1 Tax=Penaeus vannamei TaxID=6689 RepID=A0A3R7PGN0_PENVA|nr:hypothetical protein C7M84_010523 [Penaeus vannamei]
MLAFSRTSSSAFLYPHNTYSASRRVSLSGYYWMLCASLFQQGVTYPLSSPARVVFGAWIVGVIALTCAYTGVLISFLTVPRAENGVEDLHSLPKQSEFLWTFKRNSAHHSLFLGKDTTGIYAQIGAPFIGNEDELVDDNEDGIRKVLERTHVYIKERSFLDFVVEENFRRSGQCNLRIARGEFFPAGFGWIHQKGDDIGKLFNKEFILMQQTGLFAKWKLQYWPKANKCTNGGSRSLMQVSSRSVRHVIFRGSGHFQERNSQQSPLDVAVFALLKAKQRRKEVLFLAETKGSGEEALDIEDMAGSFVVLSSGFVSGVFLLVMEYFCKFRKVERAPAPKSRGKTEDPQLTVDEISERDLKTLSGTEVSSASADRPQPKEIFQILKTQKVE